MLTEYFNSKGYSRNLARRRLARIGRRWVKDAQGISKIAWLELKGLLNFNSQNKNTFAWVKLIYNYRIARESLLPYNRAEKEINTNYPQLLKENIDDQSPNSLVLFVGYPRSGHSLIGSLLDAHPEAIISHELNLLKFLKQEKKLEAILRAIKLNSLIYNYYGRNTIRYNYFLPKLFQGRYVCLKVVGDKKGNQTTRLFKNNPELCKRLLTNSTVNLSLIHVIRNPFDNIATKSLRTGKSLEKSMQRYFSNVHFIEKLKTQFPEYIIDIYLDDLVKDPCNTMEYLLDKLSLPKNKNFLQDCANIVYDKPSYTRYKVTWPDNLICTINQKIRNSLFLRRYTD